MEFSLNVFIEFGEFSDKIFFITVKGLEPATSCVKERMLPQCQQDTCEKQEL